MFWFDVSEITFVNKSNGVAEEEEKSLGGFFADICR